MKENLSTVDPMAKQYDIDDLYKGIISGDRARLSRAITLVESKKKEHQILASALLKRCMPHTGKSRRVGISGSPGVGKSTFIEHLGKMIVENDQQLAILAIDPSSQVTKGSILGDKTRMQELSRHANVFIRPSPAGETLGGIARRTRESMLLCEAAGFDYTIIETVGVGQSEITVRHLVDFFILLLLPGAGDDLQGIKKGIVEIADLILINKADGDQIDVAHKTVGFYSSAVHLLRAREDQWTVPVKKCSGLTGDGLDKVIATLDHYFMDFSTAIGKRRQHQSQYWFESGLSDALKDHFFSIDGVAQKYKRLLNEVAQGRTNAFDAVDELMQSLLDKNS